MDSVTLWIYILMGMIILVIVFAGVKSARNIIKLRKPHIRSPKLRGRSVLIDDGSFGRAVVVGLEKTSPTDAFVHLISQNGIFFKQHYSAFQIEPVDNLETMAGAERPVWRIKGTSANFKSDEQKIISLADDLKRAKINEKVAVNEAATLKDTIMDIIKEVKDIKREEGVKIIK